MSKYDKDRKFYWLQLKEDFFDEDAISWLEEQENGEKYSLFYLKLCLKSLKTKGILIREVGNMLIPYDRNKLAEITKTDVDTVTIAMELLKKIGLIEILENGEIYITQIQNLIGAKSIGAFKKEQQRLLGGRQEADKCPPLCPPEIELELEIEQEIEIEQETDEAKKMYDKRIEKIQTMIIENLGNTNLTVIQEAISYINDFPIEVIEEALKRTARKQKKWDYAKGILNRWLESKLDTLQKIQANDIEFKNNIVKVENKEETEEERKQRIIKEMEGIKDADK